MDWHRRAVRMGQTEDPDILGPLLRFVLESIFAADGERSIQRLTPCDLWETLDAGWSLCFGAPPPAWPGVHFRFAPWIGEGRPIIWFQTVWTWVPCWVKDRQAGDAPADGEHVLGQRRRSAGQNANGRLSAVGPRSLGRRSPEPEVADPGRCARFLVCGPHSPSHHDSA